MKSLARVLLLAGIFIGSNGVSGNAAEKLTGVARVIGGDTLQIGQTIIRLQNIRGIPEVEMCGPPDRLWRCGWSAINAVVNFVGQHWVTCEFSPNGSSPPQAVSAECFAGPVNINRWIVDQGWAKAANSNGGAYHQIEIDARRSRRGVWGDASPATRR